MNVRQLGHGSEFHAPRFRRFAREHELTKFVMVCLFLGVYAVPLYLAWQIVCLGHSDHVGWIKGTNCGKRI